MICRRGSPEDARRDDFRALVLSGLRSRDEGIEINERKLYAFCEAIASDNTHYGCVAEVDGVIVAYFAAVIHEHYWFDGSQMTVVGWYSTHPFAGLILLENALQWARKSMHVITLMLNFNPQHKERIMRVLQKRGVNLLDVSGALITTGY